MRKNTFRNISFFMVFFVFFTSVQSQFYSEKLFTVDDGLPQSIVNTIMKDSFGYIWVGTNEGIARFDGKTFKSYNQENGYPFHLITGIIETKPGVLWIADYGSGLFELKNDQTRHIVFDSSLKDFHVNFLVKGQNGKVLLGSEPGGIYIFKKDSLVRHYSNADGLPQSVLCATEDSSGNIWFGTFANGAFLIRDGKIVRRLTMKEGLPSNEVRSILPFKNGKIWFGTGNGLYVQNGPQISALFREKYPDSQVMSVYAPDSENVYVNISTQKGGIIHFKNNKFADELYVDKSTYSKCTFMDESDVLFIGTYNGLLVLPERDFLNYDRRSGLHDTYIHTITRDPAGKLWVGTKNDGLYYFENGKFHPFEVTAFSERFRTPTALRFIKKEFWIGTRRGLLILENGKSVQNSVTAVADSLEIRNITIIDSAIYLVSRKKILKIKEDTVEDITFNLSDSVNSIWGVQKDTRGTLWAATNGWGIWTLEDTAWVPFQSKIVSKQLYGVRRTPSGSLLFPGSSGAFLWDGEKFKNILPNEGNVWDVLATGDHDFWFGTSHGLVHKVGKQWDYYSRKNGYVSTEFNIGSFYKDTDQSLWFGGVTGLMHYLIQGKYKTEKRPLVINSIQAGDSLVSFPQEQIKTLKFEKKNIAISYTLLSFRMPSAVHYRVFLEGFDTDTSSITDETRVSYTNLYAGSYTFHVFAYYGDRSHIYKTASFSFEIKSDWWESWWAIMIYAILIFLTIYYFIHWREKLLRRRNMLLEQRIEERMFELRASNRRLVNEVNERIRAEKALEEEKEQLAVTLAAITDGVIRLDESGHVVLMNDVAKDLCGITQTEAIGAEINSVLNLIDSTSLLPTELDVSNIEYDSKNKPHTIFALLKNKRTGKELNIYLSIAPIIGMNQQIHGYVCVFRDITLEKKAEEETIRIQKLESIGLLAGGLAHDFNNILSGILGNTQLARMVYEKGENIEKYLIGVEEATKSAAALTQQLLTFSKGGEPVKKQVDIKELLEETILFALRGSNVKSAFFIENKLWSVNVDAGQINQVINNLTINADQAMPNGGTLTIEASNVNVNDTDHIGNLKPGKYVEIKLTDQGIGIPEANLSKIFDPYFTTKQKGSGLGLASSYSIIEKHEGIITVQSKVGKGTTFTIYLPAQKRKPSKSQKQSHKKIEAGSGKILVMDDESYIRELMKDMLDLLGYETVVVENGEEAIREYKEALNSKNPFRAVIMDLTIPGGMGGKDAIRELLKIDPHVRSIVSSGYSADSIMANFGDFGFKGILQKPFKIEEVGMMLDEVLNA